MLYEKVAPDFAAAGLSPSTSLTNTIWAKEHLSTSLGNKYVTIYLAGPNHCTKDTHFCSMGPSAYRYYNTELVGVRCSRTFCWFNPGATCKGWVPQYDRWDKYGFFTKDNIDKTFYSNLLTIYSTTELANGGWAPAQCRLRSWFISKGLDKCPILKCEGKKRTDSKRAQLFDILSSLSSKEKKNVGGGYHRRQVTCGTTQNCAKCTEPDQSDQACGGLDMMGRPLCCTCSLVPTSTYGSDDPSLE